MMGTQSDWYYRTLAGIDMAPGSRGWANITLAPRVPSRLAWVRAQTNTIRGMVSASWVQHPSPGVAFAYNVTVPAGSVGTVVIPGTLIDANTTVIKDRAYTTVWQAGAWVAGCSGVYAGRADAATGSVILSVDPESYMFTCSG